MSDGVALEDAVDEALDEAVSVDVGAEEVGVAVGEDALSLGVAVWVGDEGAEGLDGWLGVDEVEGAPVLVDVLGVSDGVVSGWVACVVGGGTGTDELASGIALVLVVPGSDVSEESEASDEIELTGDPGVAAEELPPSDVAVVADVVPAVAAMLTCEFGVCLVTGTEMAEAWAGWLAAVVPRVIAMAAAATPTTQTELSSTPLVGCIDLNAGWGPLLPTALGFTRACRAPVLLSRIAFPSLGPGAKSPP